MIADKADKAEMAKPYFEYVLENARKKLLSVALTGTNDEILESANMYKIVNNISKMINSDVKLKGEQKDGR